jgi:prenyltransferase beta subunit
MRCALAFLLAAGMAVLPAAPAFPGDREEKDASPGAAASLSDRITQAHQDAITDGVEWLARQQLANGAFPTCPAGVDNASSANYQTAVTALATLALLGAGHGLKHDDRRETVTKAVSWLLSCQEGSVTRGYVRYPGDTQSKMHGHGFATLALAEAYGTAASPPSAEGGSRNPEEQELRRLSERLRAGVQAAVDCIQDSQSTVGGWDYEPTSGNTTSHEGSVTVCQVQALLAAANRGFKVSQRGIDNARRYMKASQSPGGGFRYRLSTEGGSESWALTAAGLTSLLGLAEYDRKEAMDLGFKYLGSRPRPVFNNRGYPFYGSFYAVQAYHWAGGERWDRFWNTMRPEILNMRGREVYWTGQDTTIDLGPVYPTSLCLLMLEVPVGYLSIFAK